MLNSLRTAVDSVRREILRLVKLFLVLGKLCLMVWVDWGTAQVSKGMALNIMPDHLAEHLIFK